MYLAASITIITFFFIQVVRPLAIAPARNDTLVPEHSSRNHPVRSLDPTSYKTTHDSKNITPRDKSRKSLFLRTDQKQGDTSEEIDETHDHAATIVAVSTPTPTASTKTNVLLYPRKRANNSGCCSGNSVSAGVHVSCNMPCLK